VGGARLLIPATGYVYMCTSEYTSNLWDGNILFI